MKVQIYFLTRDYRLLFALTVLILGVGILLGIRLSGTAAAKGDYSGGDPEAAFREMLAKASSPEGEPVEAIAGLLRFFASEDEDTFSPLLSRELAASPLSPARRQLYSAYWNSITSLSGKPNAYLLTLAYRQQLPGANYLAATLFLPEDEAAASPSEETDRALYFLRREADFPQSRAARNLEIGLRIRQNDLAGLAALSNDARYAKEWTPLADFLVSTYEFRVIKATAALARSEIGNVSAGVIGLVVLSGLLWFTLCMQAMQALEAPAFRISAGLLALILGMFTVVPTLMLDVWINQHTSLRLGQGVMSDLLYCIGSIGLREEFSKLLAFLPFVPLLLLRKNRLEMLMIAACVGLGFAVAENLQYFERSLASTFSRFLTANCFHLAATGLIGLSLCESLMDPLRRGWWFPVCFLWVTVVHGLYDAFLINPFLSMASGASILFFLWMALVFFRQMRRWRSEESNYFWMPATILLGLALLLSATYVEASRLWDSTFAAYLLGIQAVSLCMMVYLLIWQTGNMRLDHPEGAHG